MRATFRWKVRADDGACDQDAMRVEASEGDGDRASLRAAAEAMRERFTTPGSRVEVLTERACGHLHVEQVWSLDHDGRWTAFFSPLDSLLGVMEFQAGPAITSRGGRA